MGQIQLTEQIKAPVAEVFALATDLPRAAEHIDGIDKIEMLTDGPVGVGTKWRETRKMFGKQAVEVLEVTAFDPPQSPSDAASYTAEAESCGCHFASTFRFEADGAATRVTLSLATRSLTLAAKLMAPLSALMMGACKKAMAQDLADLKRVAEQCTA